MSLMFKRTVFVASLCVGLVAARDVTVHITSKAGDRITAKAPLHFQPAKSAGAISFRIDDTASLQHMDGFGATFLEAGMMCLNTLPKPQQDAVLRALFDPIHGAGFSAMKTPIAGTDFMSAGGWYTYDDTPGDVGMKHFSIARDLGPNGVIPYIKRAAAFGKFVLQSPMDYPPDWMLFDLQKNQDVNPKYFPALALYYLRYAQEYAKNGVHIDYVSLFNEPGAYTKIPYTKIRDLLKNHVGPLFEKSGITTRLQLSEAFYRENAAKNYPIVLDDPAARRYVANAPYHGYDFKNYDKLAALIKRYPGLPFWMTETLLGGRWARPAAAIRLRRRRHVGQQIFSDIQAGASAWIYWNTILEREGRPLDGFSHSRGPGSEHPAARASDQQQDAQSGLPRCLLLSGALQQVRAAGRCARRNHGLRGQGPRPGIPHTGRRLGARAPQQPQRTGDRHGGLARPNAQSRTARIIDRHISVVV